MKSTPVTPSADLDDIRTNWQAKNAPSQPMDQARIERLMLRLRNERSRGIKHRIVRRELILAIIGMLILPLNAISLYRMMPIATGPCIAMAVYGLVVGLACMNLYSEVKSMDLVFTPTVQALQDIARFETHRFRMRIVSISLMVPVLIWLLYSFYDIDPSIFYAGAVGGVIGGAIGLNIEFRMKRDIDALKKIISDTEQDI